MKPKMILKLTVDMAMTVVLFLLMAYELIGQAVHEWIGIGMFILFIIHHILNSGWSRNLLKGRYKPCAHCADNYRISGTLYDDWFHDKRRHPFPPRTVFSSHKRRARFCQKPAFGFRLLGICIDVPSSWTSLEYDDGNCRKAYP